MLRSSGRWSGSVPRCIVAVLLSNRLSPIFLSAREEEEGGGGTATGDSEHRQSERPVPFISDYPIDCWQSRVVRGHCAFLLFGQDKFYSLIFHFFVWLLQKVFVSLHTFFIASYAFKYIAAHDKSTTSYRSSFSV